MKILRLNIIPISLALLGIVLTLVLLVVLKNDYPSGVPKGYVEVVNYEESVEGRTCLLASPICGDCFGVIRERRCFVNPNELSTQEREQVKLDT